MTRADDSSAASHGTLRDRILSETRLKLSLLLFMSGLVLTLSVLFFLLVDGIFGRLTPTIEEDLRWIARRGAVELSRTADVGILTQDPELVLEAFGDYRNHGDVVALLAVDTERIPIAVHGQVPAAIGDAFRSPASEVREVGDYLVVWEECEIEGAAVGAVAVVLSEQRLHAGDDLRRTLLMVMAVGAALALLAALLFVALYVGPLVRLTERTFKELSVKTEEALESSRLKDEFITNISHELRTPMNGVLGMLDLLVQAPLPDEQARYGQLAIQSADELLDLLNQILDFANLQKESLVLRQQVTDLQRVIDDVVAERSASAEAKGLALLSELDDSVPAHVQCDRRRLGQILTELVGNAVKFTEEGHVRLQVSLADDEDEDDRQDWREGRVAVRFAIDDTGSGITEQQRRLIFRPFTQGDGSLTRAHGGMGLGLALTERLVRALGGELQLQSHEGSGTSFSFTLRLEIASSAEVAEASENERPPSTSEHQAPTAPILVVEDNLINLQVITKMLQSAGNQVVVARDGREALERISEGGEFALVFMDCQMPVMDGYTATTLIREREASAHDGRHLPIVACTAHAREGERERALAAGMDDFLAKPVRREQLVQAIARWA